MKYLLLLLVGCAAVPVKQEEPVTPSACAPKQVVFSEDALESLQLVCVCTDGYLVCQDLERWVLRTFFQ